MLEEFRNRLQSERVELYNYFHDHTWGNDYTNIFIYTLPGTNAKKPEHTRKERFGAHFVIKRYYAGQRFYEAKRSVYSTNHTEIVRNKECFVIRQDVLDSLAQDHDYKAYVLFETDDSFAEMIDAKELRKDKYIFHKAKNQQGIWKFYFPIEAFPLHKKNSVTPEEDISFFQPKFLGNYRFKMTTHGHETNIHVYKEGKLLQTCHFRTIADFFNHFNLAEKGAKLESVQKMFKKHQNFIFKGLTFIFDDNWEIVEYKIRLSKEQKKLVAEIEAKKAELAKAEPEEEIVQIVQVADEEEGIEVVADMSLNDTISDLNPQGMYWDEEKQNFEGSLSLWDMT